MLLIARPHPSPLPRGEGERQQAHDMRVPDVFSFSQSMNPSIQLSSNLFLLSFISY